MELKNETRESFIFHAEYIADIPEELQPQYAMHAINYALKGIEPELTDWRDVKMWNAIKSRIDQERELYEKKCSNLKQKQKKTPDTDKAPSETENDASDTDEEISETDKAKSDGVYESEFDIEFVNETETDTEFKPERVPSRETPSVIDYSNRIYKVFHEAGLPCARNNPISFLQRDFKNAMAYIHKTDSLRKIPPQDIIQACKNYAATVNNPASFITGKYSFERLVTFKNFVDYLPENYVPENFVDKKAEAPSEKPKPEWKDVCPKCGSQAMSWDNAKQKYRCTHCGQEFEYEEVHR